MMKNHNHEDVDDAFGEQMEQLLTLVNARASGLATNDQVERAVETMLQTAGVQRQPPPPAAAEKQPTAADSSSSSSPAPSHGVVNDGPSRYSLRRRRSDEPSIEADEEDYDNEETEGSTTKKQPAADDENDDALTSKKRKRGATPKRKRGRPRKNKKPEFEMDWSIYEEIPLGKQGAQMMMTFGDGKRPKPATVKAALMGARRMLHVAIQDARHVRRKQKTLYRAAKDTLKVAKPKKPVNQNEWSSELVYRAMRGHDALAFDHKCGFDVEQLRQLFPEEMNAYGRWNEMHSEYAAEATKKYEADETALNEESEKSGNKTEDEEEALKGVATAASAADDVDAGGHLHERMAQFDVRTDRMMSDWYMKFSDIRQGSFLPRRLGRKSADEQAWEDSQQSRSRGRARQGLWTHMSMIAVRFLHWVGFDPQSALPPPTDETTNALAFLGYDFFGRIVEKAIFLRNLNKAKESGRGCDETAILLELEGDEQLEESDIERAMQDPDIKPIPLYSAANDKEIGPQLYFGPGFEDRLEMELEELVTGDSKNPLSDDEKQFRQKEDELFARLAAPPPSNGVASLLDLQAEGDESEDAAPAKLPAAKKP